MTAIELGDFDRGYSAIDITGKDQRLYSLTCPLMLGVFVVTIPKVSKGKLAIVAKNKMGLPLVTRLESLKVPRGNSGYLLAPPAKVDRSSFGTGTGKDAANEIKEWQATMDHIRSLPVTKKGELPVIPVDARANEARAIKVGGSALDKSNPEPGWQMPPHKHSPRKRARARVAGLLAVGLGSAFGVSAQQMASTDPFFADGVAGFNARTYYMGVEDNSKPPASTRKEAWALGGKLFGRTGYWNNTVQFGASYYLSAPLYAPGDKDGTALLAPGQKTLSVLGELYARMKYENNTLTVGRQEIDMADKRASGVRSNRSDATYLGKLDNRMVPITYEAVLLGGKLGDSLNYYAGSVNKAKPRDSEDFTHVGSVIGANGSDSAMWMGGLRYAPTNDFWVQGWYHAVSDVIRIGFLDTNYVYRLSKDSYFRLGGQYTDQRSDGSNALTGKPFSTSNVQVYGEHGRGWLTLYGAYSRTGSGADVRTPFSSGPIYTQQVTRSFVRARESAWQLGVGTDLGAWAPGLTAYFDATRGRDAINPDSGAKLADEAEYDLGVVWTLKQKGSYLDGLRSRIRSAWVIDRTGVGDRKSTDLRIDFNLPIILF